MHYPVEWWHNLPLRSPLFRIAMVFLLGTSLTSDQSLVFYISFLSANRSGYYSCVSIIAPFSVYNWRYRYIYKAGELHKCVLG